MNAGTTTGHFDPVADALADLSSRVSSPFVVDVGGGSGTRAVPLARRGCRVLVVDESIDALAILRRRAVDAGVAHLITGIQADAVALSAVVAPGQADVVVCHHLLETVDDPASAVSGIASALRPGGCASIVVAGRFAAVLAQAAAGRFAQASALLADPEGRWGLDDPLRRRYDVSGLQALLTSHGLLVDSITGVGVASALVPAPDRPPASRTPSRGPAVGQSPGAGQARMSGQVDEGGRNALETALSTHSELREIATDLHAVVSKAS